MIQYKCTYMTVHGKMIYKKPTKFDVLDFMHLVND